MAARVLLGSLVIIRFQQYPNPLSRSLEQTLIPISPLCHVSLFFSVDSKEGLLAVRWPTLGLGMGLAGHRGVRSEPQGTEH